MFKPFLVVMLTLVCCAPSIAQSERAPIRPMHRGHRWVRSHPFTIMGLVRMTPKPFDVAQYRSAGFNSLLAWEPGSFEQLLPVVSRNRMPFHVHLEHWGGKETNRKDSDEQSLREAIRKLDSAENRETIRTLTSNPGCIGFLVNDEAVRPTYLRYTRQLLKWLRRQRPDALAFCNAHPDPWGGDYNRYIDEFAAIVDPDVLMTDVYPLSDPDGTAYNYFSILSNIRKTALEHGMPYWMFIQSFEAHGGFDRRLPSESDLRFQMFVPLTYGYTGILYFTYDIAFERGLIETTGKPNRLYHAAAKANPEVANLGRALRFLTSTRVGCVLGRHDENGTTVPNKLPRGLRAMALGAGEPMTDVVIESAGEGKDGLLGFLRDDRGGVYVMLTNLWHNAGASATDRTLTFTVKFAPAVEKVYRLDRMSGKVERLKLENGVSRIILPGGTGDLFKLNSRDFLGLTDAPR